MRATGEFTVMNLRCGQQRPVMAGTPVTSVRGTCPEPHGHPRLCCPPGRRRKPGRFPVAWAGPGRLAGGEAHLPRVTGLIGAAGTPGRCPSGHSSLSLTCLPGEQKGASRTGVATRASQGHSAPTVRPSVVAVGCSRRAWVFSKGNYNHDGT